MANKAQALYGFWSSFGWPAYDENSVPDDAVLPYITYDTGEDMLDSEISLSASLWDESTSWRTVTEKADQIAHQIIVNQRPIPLTGGGYLWIKKGSPFMRRVNDQNIKIRHIFINYQAEFLTAY